MTALDFTPLEREKRAALPTNEPTFNTHSTTPLAYDKEVFDQLCLLCGMDEMTKGPGKPIIESNVDGVFILPVDDETLDWTPSCDLTEPGSPDPSTAPVLPSLFTANHLAAFMLGGHGYFMQEACGDWATGPDETMLQRIPVRGGKVKEALCGAYDAYRDAEMVVGKLDKKIQAKTQQLEDQYREKEREASKRENFRERGISDDEYRQRHVRYKASIAKLHTRVQKSVRQSDQAFSSWRKAMVIQLLRPQAAGMAGAQPPAAPVKAKGELGVVEPATPNWKMQIQAEATALCLRLRKSGASPTKSSILGSMAEWCHDNNVKTDGKIFPSANYLRTHVLGSNHWELPN